MKTNPWVICILIPLLVGCSSLDYTVIQHLDLFDGEQVHRDMNLVFADGLITDINQKRKFSKCTQIIDGQGKTILPPLLNAHVHVRTPENLKEAQAHGIYELLDV